MRAGRTEEAGALARRVQAVIKRQNSSWLRNIGTRKSAHSAWAKVCEVLGNAGRDDPDVDGITQLFQQSLLSKEKIYQHI